MGNDGSDKYVIGRNAGYDIIYSEGKNYNVKVILILLLAVFLIALLIKFNLLMVLLKMKSVFLERKNSLFIHIDGQKNL